MSLGRLLGQLLGRRKGKPAVGGNLDPADMKRAKERAASAAAGPGVSTRYVQDPQNVARRRELIKAGIRKQRKLEGR